MSDCTGEGLKAVLSLHEQCPWLSEPVSDCRLEEAVDCVSFISCCCLVLCEYINSVQLLECSLCPHLYGHVNAATIKCFCTFFRFL